MTETLTIVGRVATDPVRGQIPGGAAVTNFRLASTHRRFDAATQTWIDAETNWFSIAAFRQLGEHAKASLRCGDSVIVTGRLRIRNWESNGKSGTSVDIDADAIGHDLRWGTTAFLRSSRASNGEGSARAGQGQVSQQGEAVGDRSDDRDHEDRDEQDSAMTLETAWAEIPGVAESSDLTR